MSLWQPAPETQTSCLADRDAFLFSPSQDQKLECHSRQTQAHFIQVFLLLPQLQEPFGKTGFLLGLLAPYTCASLATSRLWAADCVACLLPIQGEGTRSRCK